MAEGPGGILERERAADLGLFGQHQSKLPQGIDGHGLGRMLGHLTEARAGTRRYSM